MSVTINRRVIEVEPGGLRGESAADVARRVMGQPELSDADALRALFGPAVISKFTTLGMTNADPNAWRTELIDGGAFTGSDPTFVLEATVAHDNPEGVTVFVYGYTSEGDQRALVFPSGNQLPEGFPAVGDLLLFKLVTAGPNIGRFVLMSPPEPVNPSDASGVAYSHIAARFAPLNAADARNAARE